MVKFCRIVKEGSSLHFAFDGQRSEAPHLLSPTAMQRQTIGEQIIQLHAQGRSIRQIASELGCPQTNVFREMKREGIMR